MFAVDHATTALLLKKRWNAVPLIWLLLSVQALEIVWVALNAFNIEKTTTEPQVTYVGDIHLSYMPISHSVLGALIFAAIAWVLARLFLKKPSAAIAVSVGVLSHLVLDLFTHAPDIALYPGSSLHLGVGLYAYSPLVAFAVEIAYGIFCWWVFQGTKALLVVIVIFNLANTTLFVPQIVGIEGLLAGHPGYVVALVAAQIVLTLALVGWLAQRQLASSPEPLLSRVG